MPRRLRKQLYSVGKIVGHRNTEKGVEYKVHWQGYPSSEDTWEPETSLEGCIEYIQQYIMSSSKKPRRSARLAAHPEHSVSYSFSTDEEVEETTDRDTVRSPKAKRVTRSTRQKTKAKSPRKRPAKSSTSYSYSTDEEVEEEEEIRDQDTVRPPVSTWSLRQRKTKSPPKQPIKPYVPVSYSFSDEEVEEEEEIGDHDTVRPLVSTRSMRQKKIKAKPPAKPRTPTKPPVAQVPVKASVSFSLKSTSTNLSCDEEMEKTPQMSRMGLSESKFRKRIADIGQSKFVSSTPYTPPVASSKARLDFNDSDSAHKTTTTTTTFTVKGDLESDCFVGEADDNEIVTTDSDRPGASTWLAIGWKEMTLASFLFGLGVVGYICYFSDVCNYC